MKIENVLSKAQLSFPGDIVLLRPETIAQMLHEKAGIKEDEIPGTLSTIFEFALGSERFSETIPPGLSEGAVDVFKILVTARLAGSIENLTPSIVTIARFSKLSRNLVSPCVKLLATFDLISTRPHMREQLVYPTPLTDLYINVMSGNLKEEYNRLEEMTNEVKRGELSGESLEFLENLETAFHIAELAYNENTMNYEIMKDLHDKAMTLVVEAKKGQDLSENLHEFLDIVGHIIKVREKAKKMGIRPIVLENTNEKLGRARVFRVK